jgi:hypothetical protein
MSIGPDHWPLIGIKLERGLKTVTDWKQWILLNQQDW